MNPLVPGGETVRSRGMPRPLRDRNPGDDRVLQGEEGLRTVPARQPVHPLQECSKISDGRFREMPIRVAHLTKHIQTSGQPTPNRLAELQTEMELFRGAIYSAVDAMLAGQNVTMHASMLKLKAGRLCRYIVA